jgi:hypothetical protein
VILEGINLPIDNMFRVNIYGTKGKQLVNLIGRVNRLNTIFSNGKINLDKLNPKIHFINSIDYKNDGHNPKIKELRNRIFDDVVEYPHLVNKNAKETYEDMTVRENEKYLDNEENDLFSKWKRYFIENSLDLYYKDLNSAINACIENSHLLDKREGSDNLKVLDLMYEIFIKNLDGNVKDYEFERLQRLNTRIYYASYVKVTSRLNLKQAIKKILGHFQEKAKSDYPKMYFGQGFGDVCYSSNKYDTGMKVYVDLRKPSKRKLANLAVVKLKMEENFVNNTLNRFVEALFDFNLISEEERDVFIYGSVDKTELDLYKMGLSKRIIYQLKSDSQLENIYFDRFGNLSCNKEFKMYLDSLSEFKRFELKKYF